jgi:hypothetical protein
MERKDNVRLDYMGIIQARKLVSKSMQDKLITRYSNNEAMNKICM